MLGMNTYNNAQHTAESMQLRPCDILPLVKARAKDHPYELSHLKREKYPKAQRKAKIRRRLTSVAV